MIEKTVVKKSKLFKTISMVSRMYLDLCYVIDESGNLTLSYYDDFVIKDGSNKTACLVSNIFKRYFLPSNFIRTDIFSSRITKERIIE